MRTTIFTLLALAFSGCLNLYTRAPFTTPRIEAIYQSSRIAGVSSMVIAYPQMMSDLPDEGVFSSLNFVSIPIGVLVGCDAVCEAAIDTIFLPADFYLEYRRRGGTEGND